MKFWKKWPYWAKGGVVGLCGGAVLLTFGLLTSRCVVYDSPGGLDCPLAAYLGVKQIIVYLLFLLVPASVFSFFTWLYDKVKTRK